jgi:hypothetical protein
MRRGPASDSKQLTNTTILKVNHKETLMRAKQEPIIFLHRGPIACVLVLASGCASSEMGDSDLLAEHGDPVGVQRTSSGGGSPFNTPFNTPRNTPIVANAHLTYHGGRVVSNMQVVQVIYGAGSCYRACPMRDGSLV